MGENELNHIKRERLHELGVGEKSWWEGQSYYEETKTIVRTYRDGLFGLEIDNEEFLPPINSLIECFYKNYNDKEIWLLVKQNNKYGLIKCTEHITTFCLEIKYDEISHSHIKCNGFYGIYDIYKGIIIPCIYDKVAKTKFDNIYIVKQNGFKGIHGLIPCIYDDIELYSYTKDTNYSIVVRNGLYGIYGNGKEIIPTIYDEINIDYHNGIVLKKGNLKGFYTEKNSIVEPQYEDINKLCPQYYAFSQFGKWGVINNYNEIIVPPIYQDIKLEKSDNDLFFSVLLDDYMGILNTSGTTIIPIKFNDIIIEEGIFYLRIGKNMYVWDKVEKFIKTFWSDYSCGYDSINSSIMTIDSNLIDLLTPLSE